MEPTPFSWSYSRHRTFQDCPRKYWLHYYAAARGEEPDADPRLREVFVQKYLVSRPAWVGTLVHDAAEQALLLLRPDLREIPEGEEAPPAPPVTRREELAEFFLDRARREVEGSQSGTSSEDPRARVGFEEHYYGIAPRDHWEVTFGEIFHMIQSLPQHPIFRRLEEARDRVVEVERLVEVELMDVIVRLRLDVLVRDEHDGMVIIDWKTGRSHRASNVLSQLGVYGLYVQQAYGARAAGLWANLRVGGFSVHPLGEDALARAASLITSSSEAMQLALEDPENNAGREEDFPTLPEGSGRCRWCRFRRTCARETGT